MFMEKEKTFRFLSETNFEFYGLIIFSLNVFNFDYLFINGKEKINSSINGVREFSEEFLKDKINENKDIVASYVKESKNRHWKSLMDESILNYIDNYSDYYNELKEFKSFNILYYDDELICIYKRTVKADERSDEAIVKNHSFIFECSLSSYVITNEEEAEHFFQDFLQKTKENIQNIGYLASQFFYRMRSDLDNILQKSFLEPAVHSPHLFGISATSSPFQQSRERILLSVLESKKISHLLYLTLTKEEESREKVITISKDSQHGELVNLSFLPKNEENDEAETNENLLENQNDNIDDDIFYEIMKKIPSYSHSMIFSGNDLKLLN